jgi:hypothetical protein
VRVYLPVTWADLAATGTIRTHGAGHAVTADVRDADPDGDIEDWEFAAFLDACASALEMLRGATPTAAAATTPPRRVVVAVDLDPGAVRGGSGSRVDVPAVVDVAQVAAVHVDGEQAEPAVASVLGGQPADLLDDVALEWYHPDELDALLSRDQTAEETG